MSLIEVHHATGPIAEVELARPKVNAMNRTLLTEMKTVFNELARDERIRGVLVKGAGKTFSAGLDLTELMSLDADEAGEFLRLVDEGFDAAFRFTKPMAAAVHGHAIAGGLILALCADYVVMAPGSYKIGLTEIAVGVPLPRVAFEVVRAALPPRGERALVFGSDVHTPNEAFALGVGDALDADPAERARRWLEPHAERPGAAFEIVKGMSRREAFARIDSLAEAERATLQKALLASLHARSLS